MSRIKELREEKNISKAELAKLIELKVYEPSDIDNVDDYRKLDQEQVEKIAMLFGVTVAYLKGNIQNLSKEEREYRKKLKQLSQYQLDMIESNFVTSNEFSEEYAQTLDATAQLCIAANIVTLTESVERLTEEIVKSNDHRLSDIDNETKEDDYEDNMFLLDDDN